MEKSREQRDKERMYMDYIYKHIKHITEVYRDFVEDSELENDLSPAASVLLKKNLMEHDQSKFSREEFNGYRKKFYPTEEELKELEKIEKQFSYAWLHHIRYNPHHWNHWIIVNGKNSIIPLKMPQSYIIEMLIDWKAMSLKFNDKIEDFYNKKKDSMVLHEETIKGIENMIEHFI